jgi:8-oxo-dGTP pyrophosphatase MutT (NUDIX family)
LVFDSEGRVLLREPRGHFDGYVWTFAKGRPDPGESPDATARREAEEETCVHARILAPIPGEFAGGTTINRFFLMVPDGPITPLSPHAPETISVRWVKPDEARTLIEMTQNATGKERDLAVLEAGLKEWAKQNL